VTRFGTFCAGRLELQKKLAFAKLTHSSERPKSVTSIAYGGVSAVRSKLSRRGNAPITSATLDMFLLKSEKL
jgi:hypothetical protein